MNGTLFTLAALLPAVSVASDVPLGQNVTGKVSAVLLVSADGSLLTGSMLGQNRNSESHLFFVRCLRSDRTRYPEDGQNWQC